MSYVNSRALLKRAHRELDDALTQRSLREKFIRAHMAALRAAAAALALSPPETKRGKVKSAWVQLAELGPQWAPWVEFYTASAQTRAAIEAGLLREIAERDVEQAVQVASQFLHVVESHISEYEEQFRRLAYAS